MEGLEFRTLAADEIECRVAQAGKTQKGGWCSLLLYKDARCDQRLLDETVGCFRWKREHMLINGSLFCTVSIKADDGEWVSKQDVGTESNTEKEKGQASDAFKRACFNWGLGRELYTSPKIFVSLSNDEFSEQQGRVKVNPRVSFKVSSISYDSKRNICSLEIVDAAGNVRFSFGEGKKAVRKTKKEPVAEKPVVEKVVVQVSVLEEAEKEIANATSKDELLSVFEKYKDLHSDQSFMNKLKTRKNQILSKNGNAAA